METTHREPNTRARLQLQARDIMTAPVITALPETIIRDLAALMTTHRISGIPIVTSEHELVGIVTEGDLLYKEVMPKPQAPPTVVRRLPIRAVIEAHERVRKAEGTHAFEIMSSPVLTVTETAAVHEIARVMLQYRINSLTHDLWIDLARVTVEVKDGVVYLDGAVERKSEKDLAERWAVMADGVIDVRNRLTYTLDDAQIRPELPRR